MTTETCRVCSTEVLVMARKGTELCSLACEKAEQNVTPQPQPQGSLDLANAANR